MEALLLAPNTPAQNGPQQQDMPDAPPSGDEAFAPMLNKAVTRQQNKNTGEETSPCQKAGQCADSDTPETVPETSGFGFEALPPAVQNTPVETAGNLILSAKISSQISLFAQSGQTVSTQQEVNQPPVSPLPLTPVSPDNELQALATLEPNAPVSSKAETLLLEQIQQLIDNGKNKGPIIVQNNTQNSSAVNTDGEHLQKLPSPLLEDALSGEIQVKNTNAAILTAENSVLKNNKTANVEPIRQDSTGQFFKARINETLGKNDTLFQQSGSEQQGKNEQNNTTLQTGNALANSSLSAPGLGDPQQGNHFSLNNALPEQVQATVATKLAPPLSTPVTEAKIVDSLVQRFHVNPRLQTSKFSMQLHPAELGELKIDLQIKEDTIRANIVAQSQQVIDTLDKHMPRLRAALQEQGFNIDSFTITLDSESSRQQDFFQEHFSSQQQNDSSFTQTSSLQDETFAAELEHMRETMPSSSEEAASSGINVTI